MRRVLYVLSLLFFSFVLISCSSSNELTVSSIKVLEDNVALKYEVGEFDFTNYSVELLMSDGTKEVVLLKEAMISRTDLDKLSVVGKHIITVNYENITTSIEVEIIATSKISTINHIYITY